MSRQLRNFARKSLWLLPIWAALLFLGTLTHQPDPLTDFAGFSEYITTNQFLLSHLIASIGGAAIGSIGYVGLMLYLQDSRSAGRSIAGMAAAVAGNILLSSIFGIATFAQPAMGRLFLSGAQNSLDFYNQVYTLPLFGTALVALLLFMAGGIFMGTALASSGRFPKWIGWVYAVAVVVFALSFLFLPIGQSIGSAVLFIMTLVILRHAPRSMEGQGNITENQLDLKPEPFSMD